MSLILRGSRIPEENDCGNGAKSPLKNGQTKRRNLIPAAKALSSSGIFARRYVASFHPENCNRCQSHFHVGVMSRAVYTFSPFELCYTFSGKRLPSVRSIDAPHDSGVFHSVKSSFDVLI